MAVITTHVLNSVNGSHAGDVKIAIFQIAENGNRTKVFNGATDDSGRLSVTLEASEINEASDYEMVLQSGKYFEQHQLQVANMQVQKEIVIRFVMPDAQGKYHMPLMMAPNSYSVWFSG